MKLPNADRAVIERDKLVGYLLDPEHLYGGPKARLLLSLGYTTGNWRQLEADLRQALASLEISATEETAWGTRYAIIAPLGTALIKSVRFRTIWQIDLGTDAPRLITMYPE